MERVGYPAIPEGDGVKQKFLSGIYENDYIKRDGKSR
jgi:hypothetical protein